MIGAIVAMHLVFAYITGLNFQPFDISPYYVFMILPVIVFLGIFFYAWHAEWGEHDSKILTKNSIATLKNFWFWFLILLSVSIVIGIMYYAGQMLLPKQEISRAITYDGDAYYGAMFCLGVCTILYLACLIWLRKTLRLYWK